MIKQIYRKECELFIPSKLEKSIDYYKFSDHEAGDGGVFYIFGRSLTDTLNHLEIILRRGLK